jgi:hypothetical protein
MIPIESTRLPREVKQALLNRNEFLFPPQCLSILSDICTELNIPTSEVRGFCIDNDPIESLPDCDPLFIHGLSLHWTDGLIDLCGPPISGKTFFCHTLASRVLGNRSGVVFVDTDGSYSSDIITCKETPPLVFRVYGWEQLLWRVHLLEECVKSFQIRLVIVDSIASPFRHALSDHLGRKNQVMKCICDIFREINKRYKCLVVLVNQMTTKIPNGEVRALSDSSLIPSLGKGYQTALTSGGRFRRIAMPLQ